jgi:uncharacterized membrane protein (UPF0182 family)
VGDLFDDFMKELRRRQAEAGGRSTPDQGGDADPRSSDDDADADADDTDAGAAIDHRDADADHAHPLDDEPAAEDGADDDDSQDEPRPIPIRPGRPRPVRNGRSDRDAGRRPPPPRGPRTGVGGPRDGSISIRTRVTAIIAVVIVVFVVLMLAVGIDLWTDVIWYKSVGFDQVFWTRLGMQSGLFALGGIVALLLLLGNVWLAGRLSPTAGTGAVGGGTLRNWIDRLNEAAANADPGRSERSQWDRWNRSKTGEPENVTPLDLPDPVPLGRTVIVAVCVLAALGVAGTVSGSWQTIVLWQNQVPFDPSGTPVLDPIFHMDISFFLFQLPFLRLLQTIASGLLVASLIVTGGRYLLSALAGASVFDTRVRVHLGVLAGLFLMTIALGYQLDKLELVHSTRGIASGVSFTDQNAQFLAYNVLTIVSAIAAALLVGGAFARVLWPVGLTLVVWFIASIVVGRIYPAAVQQLSVVPNQQAQETPYIANNIAMTRLAFGLGSWTDQPYAGNAPITAATIAADSDTFANARLWDYRPLGDTLGQLQTVQRYYEFTDVDTDRYPIGDSVRQVMLSGRELALENNTDATGWVNQHIVYTHGIGLAMVPVNEVASQGQPHLIISNLPPVSTDGAPPINRPQIYFGERPNAGYAIVDAKQDEFDYPRGVGDTTGTGGGTSAVTTRWTGKTGIPLNTTLDRLLWAARFRDFNLLISDQVTADSQLLFRRSLGDRLPLIAPFLLYDKDPYLVVDGSGDLKYVQDAFTTSDQFPHAQSFDPSDLTGTGLGSDPFNYIRNSVKIVMDAYDGSMTFYVADDSDPIIRAWEGVFPTLFHPMSEMPADLLPHLRVPEELFDVQTRMYGRYHVTDPATFYTNNDLWTVPAPASSTQSLPNEAYYVMMRMPGADKAEFLLLQPMIPKSRPNMIAWIAAQNDPGVRGKTTVFRFPSESSIFGPAQVEAQIDSDPIISAQTTLWDQSGSKVVRGNLIVVPVGGSLIYLQPVYLQSASSKFPAFQRIVVASPRNIVWGSTLQEALNLLLAKEANGGGGSSPPPGPTPTPGPSATPGPTATPGPGETVPPGLDVQQLVDFANQHYELAQQALRNGDLAQYQAEIDLVGQAIAQAQLLTGGGSPAPSLPSLPSAAPSAAP